MKKHKNQEQIIANSNFKKDTWKEKTKLQTFFYILFYLSLIFSFFRIPYTGSFLDAYIFEYFFGIVKYFIYLSAFIVVTGKFFNWRFIKIFKTKRFIILFILIILIFSLMISGTFWLFDQQRNFNFNFQYVIDQYHDHFKQWASEQEYHLGFFNEYFSGGIIGEIVTATALFAKYFFVYLMVLFLFLIWIVVFLTRWKINILKSIKQKLILFLGGSVQIEKFDDLNYQKKSNNKPFDQEKLQAHAANLATALPSSEFLIDTTINNIDAQKETIKKQINKILNFCKKEEIYLNFVDAKVMPSFSEVQFQKISDEELEKIFNKRELLAEILEVNKFNVVLKNNLLIFEYRNTEMSRFSVKELLNKIAYKYDERPKYGAIGFSYDKKDLWLPFDKSPKNVVFGSKGSGLSSFVCALIASYAFNNDPKDLKIHIFDHNSTKASQAFNNLAHMNEKTVENFNETSNVIRELKQIIIDRLDWFRQENVSDYQEFNERFPDKKLPKHLIVFYDFDTYVTTMVECEQLLKSLISPDAIKAGIQTVLISQQLNSLAIDKQFFNQFNSKFIFKTSEASHSQAILDNTSAYYLYGNGDGYYLDHLNNEKKRFQACFINLEEISRFINVINTFYEKRNK